LFNSDAIGAVVDDGAGAGGGATVLSVTEWTVEEADTRMEGVH